MATKRPANGCNYAERRSNMNGQGKKWKEQLVQGVREKEIKETTQARIDAEVKYRNAQKQKLREEARKADVELGFISASDITQQRETPEWKKNKIFLRAAFPPPTVCKRYNNELVFKNKQSMQGYHHRVITDSEWAANLSLLMTMRADFERISGVATAAELACDTDQVDCPDTNEIDDSGGLATRVTVVECEIVTL
jgi:hypothetical protein